MVEQNFDFYEYFDFLVEFRFLMQSCPGTGMFCIGSDSAQVQPLTASKNSRIISKSRINEGTIF